MVAAKTMASKSTTPHKLDFHHLNQLNKNDISAILLRYNTLAVMYREKIQELAKMDEKSTDEVKANAFNELIKWAASKEKLDPFIGDYETKEASWRLGNLLNRAVPIKMVKKTQPTALVDPDSKLGFYSADTSLSEAMTSAKSTDKPKRAESPSEVSSSKQYKLGGSTPTFGASETDDIHDWLFMVEESFISCGIPEEMQLHVIAPFLRGEALKSLKRFMRKEGTEATWDDFRDQLIKEYEPHDIQNRLKLQLMRLKQTESFDKYVAKFKSIVNRIDNITDEDTVLLFTEGLQPKTRLEVLNKNCSTLEEAIIYASNAECCLSRPIEINMTRLKKTFKPRRKNYQARPNPKPTNKPNQLRCFHCNKLGHISKNCFKKRSENLEKGDRRAWKPKLIAVCRSNSNSLLLVRACVEGTPVFCAIDSGAQESVLSAKLVRKLGLKIEDTFKKIKSVNNQVNEALGEVLGLTLAIGDLRIAWNFIVLDLDDHDILLGLDWLQRAGACIDYSRNLMQVGRKVIKLTSSDQEHEEVDICIADVENSTIVDVEEWNHAPQTELKPASQLDSSKLDKFKEFQNEICSVVAHDLNDLGTCTVRKFKIELTEEQPFYCPPYRKSVTEREKLREEIEIGEKSEMISNFDHEAHLASLHKKYL